MTMNSSTITPEDLLAHAAWLQRLARRLVDRSTADDLVQETWAAAVRARPDRERPLRPWLSEVLRNLARMRARGRGRWEARAAQVEAAAQVPLPTPEELLTYHEAQRLVADVVAQLEEPYRSTVLLCYAQEVSPGEIARQQGIPAGTVRWRLKRGLELLRTALDVKHGGDGRAWAIALGPLSRVASSGSAPVTAMGSGGGLAAGVALGKVGLDAMARPRTLVTRTVGLLVAVATVALVSFFLLDRASPRSATALATRSLGEARGEGDGALARRLDHGNEVPRLMAAPPTPSGTGPQGSPPQAAVGVPHDADEIRKRVTEVGDSPVRGPKDAPVTIVMWSEFQCPFCARVQPTLRALEAAYPNKIRFVWKHLPLGFHESAQLASEAALAAQEQGKFWEMSDVLFLNQDRLDPAALAEHAKTIGLDVARFQAALDGGKFRKRVEEDVALAKTGDVAGAPTFFINGEKMVGAQPLESFKWAVEVALAAAQGLPPPEAPRAAHAGPGMKGATVVQRPLGANPVWPPVAVTLPDDQLGARVKGRFATAKAPMRGTAKAPIEVLYFTQLAPSQGRMMLEGLLASYGPHVRLYAKFVPLASADFRDDKTPEVRRQEARTKAQNAIEAALFAESQGKFWELYNNFESNPYTAPERAALDRSARKAGLDVAALAAALERGTFREQALEEMSASLAAGIATDTFVIDGRRADGSVALAQLLDAAFRRAGLPVPARKPTPSTPPISPVDPKYDPQRLLMQMTPLQLFAIEPRDDAWAVPVEKDIGSVMDRDLRAVVPKLAKTTVSCRSTVCRLTVAASKADTPPAVAAAMYLYKPMWTGASEVIVALRANATKSADDSIAKLKSRRATVLYNQRTGRGPKTLAFPSERLPQE